MRSWKSCGKSLSTCQHCSHRLIITTLPMPSWVLPSRRPVYRVLLSASPARPTCTHGMAARPIPSREWPGRLQSVCGAGQDTTRRRVLPLPGPLDPQGHDLLPEVQLRLGHLTPASPMHSVIRLHHPTASEIVSKACTCTTTPSVQFCWALPTMMALA